MSQIYINEPPTSAKVCLKTTAGDIDIELWAKETPLTCRNFIQLCMEGYYNDTIFHRVVKDFIIQGGDPTGTGLGGESIYGHPFKDEFQQRLKFVRRGLVAMAQVGHDKNGSQFFFTLTPAPELNGKNTLFGKVVGDTIYNMVELASRECDQNERPIEPHRIKSTVILLNPFTDIVPRLAAKPPKKSKEEKKKEKEAVPAPKKNFNLLSFGDEAEEEEQQFEQIKSKFKQGKSAHDLLHDEKLSAEPAVRREEIHKSEDEQDSSDEDEESKAERLESVRDKLNRHRRNFWSKGRKKMPVDKDAGGEDMDKMYHDELTKEERERTEKSRNEQKQLKRELWRSIRGKDDEKPVEAEEEKPEALKEYYNNKEKYMTLTKTHTKRIDKSAREAETMDMLNLFRDRLSKAKQTLKPRPKAKPSEEECLAEPSSIETEAAEKSVELEPMGPALPPTIAAPAESNELGPEVDSKLDVDDFNEDSWMVHRFEPTEAEEIGLKEAKDANLKDTGRGGEEWFEINDPRNPINRRKRGDKTVDKKSMVGAKVAKMSGKT